MIIMLIIVQSNVILYYCITFDFRIRMEGCKNPNILLLCTAIGAIGIVYVIAPPTWEDLTHLALSGLVDSSNEVWRDA